ncbi:MAG: DEAD/DEAH box helicase, partial [Acidimicrobiia bacterium]
MSRARSSGPLDRFSAPVRAWFETSFAAPTAAQAEGWPAIADGAHTLILAPTGSGKTLAAFLWAIDRLAATPEPEKAKRCRVLYVSPLRALAVDVEKNLRAPLAGIALAAERLGVPLRAPTVGMRSGDTPGKERQALVRTPPDILITTPESLYLMLTSRARETLRSVEYVIIDEIHAMAPTKRGAHLMLSLERLDALTETQPQRIGLSATQRPLDEIARFLGGFDASGARPVTIVDAGSRKVLDLEVIVPVDDMAELQANPSPVPLDGPITGPIDLTSEPRASIWPHLHPRLLELIRAHHTTIIFCNARRTAERLAQHLNDLAGEELVRAHHGSLSREQRLIIESDLKEGRLRAIVATSSLELGIDMGSVDLVVLVESPGSVARGMQRVGRAGHQVGEPSRGKIFPKYRGDLLEATAVVRRMQAGLVEEMRYPRNPIDVLAQQIVAAVAVDEYDVDSLLALIRRCANFAELSDDAFRAVLDLLSGRYPSDRFAGLRPRIVWDRVQDQVRAREGAQRVAITSGGTIPDRGLFGVFLPDGVRVGELDEEMVYESRAGETFVLGASTWRIEEINHDRVVVTPAPGEPGKTPFWRGDKPGRPLELGRALGALIREVRDHDPAAAEAALQGDGLDARAASNLRRYLEEQSASTGAVPDDRTIVVERFPDEIGDWRVCVLTPFGSRVHAPWALAL